MNDVNALNNYYYSFIFTSFSMSQQETTSNECSELTLHTLINT